MIRNSDWKKEAEKECRLALEFLPDVNPDRMTALLRLLSVKSRALYWYDDSMRYIQVLENWSLRLEGVDQVYFVSEEIDLCGLKGKSWQPNILAVTMWADLSYRLRR